MDSWFFTPTVLFCFLNLIILSIFIASCSKSHKHQLGQHDSPQLNRTSSLLSRVKSINFSFKNFDNHYPLQPEALVAESHLTGEVTPEDSLVPETTEEELNVSKPLKTMSLKEKKDDVTLKERKKSSVREPVKTVLFKGDEEVDKKADDFINRFKQQLKIQRLDSIKRYTDMLTGRARSSTN